MRTEGSQVEERRLLNGNRGGYWGRMVRSFGGRRGGRGPGTSVIVEVQKGVEGKKEKGK